MTSFTEEEEGNVDWFRLIDGSRTYGYWRCCLVIIWHCLCV